MLYIVVITGITIKTYNTTVSSSHKIMFIMLIDTISLKTIHFGYLHLWKPPYRWFIPDIVSHHNYHDNPIMIPVFHNCTPGALGKTGILMGYQQKLIVTNYNPSVSTILGGS